MAVQVGLSPGCPERPPARLPAWAASAAPAPARCGRGSAGPTRAPTPPPPPPAAVGGKQEGAWGGGTRLPGGHQQHPLQLMHRSIAPKLAGAERCCPGYRCAGAAHLQARLPQRGAQRSAHVGEVGILAKQRAANGTQGPGPVMGARAVGCGGRGLARPPACRSLRRQLPRPPPAQASSIQAARQSAQPSPHLLDGPIVLPQLVQRQRAVGLRRRGRAGGATRRRGG